MLLNDEKIWISRWQNLKNTAHWHEEAELIYCEEGCVRVYLDNVHVVELMPTECAYLEGGKIHRFDSDLGTVVIVIQIDHFYTAFTEPYRLKGAKLSLPAGVPMFYQAVKTELIAKDPFSREMIRSAVTAFLAAIYRNEETVRSPSPIRNDQQSLMKELIREMDEHYRTITFDELCERFGYSRSHFSRLFTRLFSMTFTEYITSLKVFHAVELLRRKHQNKLKVTDVAVQCGFPSIRSFNRCFLAATGYTPSRLPANYSYQMTTNIRHSGVLEPTDNNAICLEMYF